MEIYKTYPIHRNEEGQYYVWIQNTIYTPLLLILSSR